MVLEPTTYFTKAPLLQNLSNGLSAYEFCLDMKYFYVDSSWSRIHGDLKISVKLTIRNTIRQQHRLFA